MVSHFVTGKVHPEDVGGTSSAETTFGEVGEWNMLGLRGGEIFSSYSFSLSLKNLLMAENPRVVRRQHIMSWWGIIRVCTLAIDRGHASIS